MSFLGLTIYRNIYVKDYKKFPYQLLSGRNTLLYKGKIYCDVSTLPKDYDPKQDIYINCDCDFSKWKNLKRIL
jgi:hypothetical protein